MVLCGNKCNIREGGEKMVFNKVKKFVSIILCITIMSNFFLFESFGMRRGRGGRYESHDRGYSYTENFTVQRYAKRPEERTKHVEYEKKSHQYSELFTWAQLGLTTAGTISGATIWKLVASSASQKTAKIIAYELIKNATVGFSSSVVSSFDFLNKKGIKVSMLIEYSTKKDCNCYIPKDHGDNIILKISGLKVEIV